MKLIVGLGNPDQKYKNTRHNIGFILLDKYAKEENYSWSENKKFNGMVSKNGDTVLLKPHTYMNNSGIAVSKAMSFFKVFPQNLVVIHDDLDLEFGRIKKSFNSEAAGHKGVSDIIGQIGTKEFTRIRFGIGRPTDKFKVNDYVLSDFSEEELKIITSSNVFSLL